MKTERTLGLFWLVFCTASFFDGLWTLSHFHIPLASAAGFYTGIISVAYLTGAIASFLLLRRGAIWSRLLVGSVAVLFVVIATSTMVAFRTFRSSDVILVAFAIISIVLLFQSRHKSVA